MPMPPAPALEFAGRPCPSLPSPAARGRASNGEVLRLHSVALGAEAREQGVVDQTALDHDVDRVGDRFGSRRFCSIPVSRGTSYARQRRRN